MTLRVHSLTVNAVEDPGYVTLVVNTAGCHLQCPFCFNRDLWEPTSGGLDWSDVERELSKGEGFLDSVTWTGADPLEQDLREPMQAVKERGLRNNLFATPHHPATLRRLLEGGLLDRVHLSLKGSDVPRATRRMQQRTIRLLEDHPQVDKAYEFVYTSGTRHEAPELEALVHEINPTAPVTLTRALNPDYLRGETL